MRLLAFFASIAASVAFHNDLRIRVSMLPDYMAPIVGDRRVSPTDLPAYNSFGYEIYQSELVFIRSLMADNATYEPEADAANMVPRQ